MSNADQLQGAFQPRSAGRQARPDRSASQNPGLKPCSPAALCLQELQLPAENTTGAERAGPAAESAYKYCDREQSP